MPFTSHFYFEDAQDQVHKSTLKVTFRGEIPNTMNILYSRGKRCVALLAIVIHSTILQTNFTFVSPHPSPTMTPGVPVPSPEKTGLSI